MSARDGLQNEKVLVNTTDKVALIERMIDAGARRLEVARFVNPRRVPQMADGEEVISSLPDRSDVSYIGLCLNRNGVERAARTREGNRRGVDEAGCVAVASDKFGMANQNQTSAESVAENITMLRVAREQGLVAQVTIAVAFGCPFEGVVDPARVVAMAERFAEPGPAEIAVADTIGVAVPGQVRDLLGRLREVLPSDIRLRAHFHDTRATGIANDGRHGRRAWTCSTARWADWVDARSLRRPPAISRRRISCTCWRGPACRPASTLKLQSPSTIGFPA